MVLTAQMGKAGPPMDGKDLHIGDFDWGILPAAAPLADRHADDRRHGAGVLRARAAAASRSRSSAKAARRSANGTRRSTCAPRGGCRRSSASRTTRRRCRRRCASSRRCACSPTRRPATAFPASRSTAPIPTRSPRRSPGRPSARARARARRYRAGRRCACAATRITTTCSISARTRSRRGTYPPLHRAGLRRPRALRRSGRRAIRSPRYAARLEAEGVIDGRRSRAAASARPRRSSRREARRVIDAPWPEPREAGRRRVRGRAAARARRGARSGASRRRSSRDPALPAARSRRRRSIAKGSTFLEAVMLGVGDALRADPRVFVYGEDVGGTYGNAFLLLRPLLEEFGDRIINSPLAEGARARRLRRRGARRPAADRRDAVQRLRRHRLQPAREQRREDPLPLGRRGADGRAHAVGRAAPRRAVPQPEHRAVVLPHARAEDRRARRRRTTRAR